VLYLSGLGCDEIRLPRIAACYVYDIDPAPSKRFVEVAIAFQYRNQVANPPPGHWSDWAIQVVRNGFTPLDIENLNFGNHWSENAIIDEELSDDIHPDVAYDPRTIIGSTPGYTLVGGDPYVVFSRGNLLGITHVYMSKGERRNYDGNKQSVHFYPPIPVQVYPPIGQEHNGFNPRIDIGQFTIPWLLEPEDPGEGFWRIAIAYTGSNYVDDPGEIGGWHVRINYWDIDDASADKYYQHNYMVRSTDPELRKYPGGLPMLDIGPPGVNHVVLVWTQAKGHDWANSTVDYLDSRGGSYHMYTDTAWGANCSAMPSVAVHKQDSDYPFVSSISYLETGNYVNDYWYAKACTISHQEGGGVSAGDSVYTNTNISGKWDAGAIYEHSFGMSTGLAVFDELYWMVFSGSAKGAGPEAIYGQIGDTVN
jgi:hypothetical protein